MRSLALQSLPPARRRPLGRLPRRKTARTPPLVAVAILLLGLIAVAAATLVPAPAQRPVAGIKYVQVGGGSNIFNPSIVNIEPGEIVQWNWTGGCHSSTSDVASSEVWDSTTICAGTFQHQFNIVGTFPYHCTPHGGFGMVGTVNVFIGAPEMSPVGALVGALAIVPLAGLLLGTRRQRDLEDPL